MSCNTIESGRRVGDTYVIQTWGRTPIEKPPEPEFTPKKRGTVILSNQEPREREMRPLVEFEWAPQYNYNYLCMKEGDFDRLLKTETVNAPKETFICTSSF